MKILFLSFFALLLIAVMYIIGTRDYKITSKGVKVHKDLYYKVLSAILAIILEVVLLSESIDGLNSLLTKLLPQLDSRWTTVLTIIAIQTIAIIAFKLLFKAAKNGQKRVAFDLERDEKE